jgi:RHS repeat-associated protein
VKSKYEMQSTFVSIRYCATFPGVGTCAQTATATGYWTKYTYDPLNDLLSVTQNAQSGSQQTRTFAYDDMGRMTSETNPESATTTYTYGTDATCGTSKGDLVKKVDAVGNTTCFVYDALHRQTSVTYSGPYSGNTPNKYFVYDSATVNSVAMANAKTRMAEAYTCVSPCSTKITDLGFSYTVLGQAADVYESTPHSSGYYHVTASYWANGVLDQLKNLAGLPAITYGVDGEGRVTSASAASGQSPLSSTSYNTASEPTQINLGSSDSDSLTYDPNTNRETKYQFTVNSQSVVGQLTWNSIGTLETLAITDPFYGAGNQTCTYAHDDIARIASVNCGSPWSQTFGYDSFGNLTKSGSMSFAPTYSFVTNRMTQIGSSTPTYDANGNVTNDFLHTYTWDAAGRPVAIDTVTVTYDALGRMVEQDKSGVYTEIAYAPSGGKLALMTGQTLQKAFVSLTGGSMAVYTSSGLAYYRHSDWVGSSRFASTPTRAMYSDGAYGPFGEGYAQSGTTDLSFTGMNQDTVSNLYDFPAREYGTQGRWPSPGPSGSSSVSPNDPQTWNRYAYVTNSPMSYVDATGMARISPTLGYLLSIAGGLGFGSGPADGSGWAAGSGGSVGLPPDNCSVTTPTWSCDLGGGGSGNQTQASAGCDESSEGCQADGTSPLYICTLPDNCDDTQSASLANIGAVLSDTDVNIAEIGAIYAGGGRCGGLLFWVIGLRRNSSEHCDARQ